MGTTLYPVCCARCGKERSLPMSVIVAAKERGHKIYCGTECSYAATRGPRETRQCGHCGEDVTRRPKDFKDRPVIFCNAKCSSAWRKVQAKRKVTYTCAYCGKEKVTTAEKLSTKTRSGRPAHCSISCGVRSRAEERMVAAREQAQKRLNDKGELQCKDCQEWLPLSKFPVSESSILGVQGRCGKCLYRRSRVAKKKCHTKPGLYSDRAHYDITPQTLPGFSVLDLDRAPTLRAREGGDRWAQGQQVWACPLCGIGYDTAGEAKFCCQWWVCPTAKEKRWLKKATASAR